MTRPTTITVELLLEAYATGYFPMAEHQRGKAIYWFNPDMRGAVPLEDFHVPRSLKKCIRHCAFTVTVDTAFTRVIRHCANARSEKRKSTWINKDIIRLYTELHRLGHAHSVEVWDDDVLIGGLYGVSLGGAFFGESMFSLRSNASKMALAHLGERLKATGYTLLDAQFENPHLTQFGFRAMPREDYLARLRNALNVSPNPSSFFHTASVSKS